MLETGSKKPKKAVVTVCEAQELAPSRDAEQTRVLAVSITKAAKLLGVSRSTAYEAVKTAKLPAFEFMGKTLVSVRYLDDMVAQRTAAAVTAMQGVIG